MKKNLFILSAIAVTAAALVSCEKEQDVNVKEEPQGVPFEIVAGPIETKTVNDGMSTNWVAGDQINLFHAVNGETTYVDDGAFEAASDGASVSFTGTLGAALASGNYDWFAVYPYNAGFDTPAGTATITIPAAQTQAGYDSKAHLAGANCPVAGNKKNVAYDATPVIDIKHLTSVVKVHVTNKSAANITVDGVSFTAPININGAFSLDLTGNDPSLSGAGGSTTTALTVTGGTALAADESADFYMAVKYFTIAANSQITLTVSTDKGDQTLTTIVPSDYTFARGKIATLNFNFTNKPVTLAQFKYNDADWLDDQSITKPASGAGTPLTGSTQTVGEITLSSTDGSTPTRIWNKSDQYDVRVYAGGGSFSLSSTDSYLISKISVTESGLAASPTFGTNASNVAVNCGSKSGSTKNITWTGLSQNVTFTVSNTINIGTIVVFYQAATSTDHVVSLPVQEKDVAYTTTSESFEVRTVNVDDLTISCSSPGFVDYALTGTTLTVTFEANADSSPRNIVVNVSSTSAGFDEDLTIVQAGAPTKIHNLSSSSAGVTVTAQVAALTTKGFILADDTGAILVYTNVTAVGVYTEGQTVTVSGDVSAYNKGLQFNVKDGLATIDTGAAGSYSYPSATAYGLEQVTAYLANTSDRLATYVTFSGVVKKSGSYYNVIVGGGSTTNVTLYAPTSTITSGLVDGDYVTVTGYATSISSSMMAVCAREVSESGTAPALLFSDITGVEAAGVTGATHTVTPYRIPGAAPSVTCTGCVSAASINAACNTVTYSVSENTGATAKTGTIVITFTVSAQTYAYTINVSQSAPAVIANLDFAFSATGIANNTAITDVSLPTGMSYDTSIDASNYKCYANYVGMRVSNCAYIVHFNTAAASIDFTGKRQGSGASTNSMTVAGSADGITYTTIETISITETSDTKKTVSATINSSYRYIKFTFTKNNGNYALKEINIKK